MVIAALTAVALRAVRTESRVSFMLKLDDGVKLNTEELFDCLISLDDLWVLL